MKKMLWPIALVLAAFAGFLYSDQLSQQQRLLSAAQEAPKKADPKAQYARGYKPAPKEVIDRLHAEAAKKHGKRVANLPRILAPAWDCRQLGLVPPIRDQGPCGFCYGFSACGTVTCALVKAGYFKFDSGNYLSEQYGLDCQNFGGCGGGDESQVADYICKSGFPLSKDYGDYTASSNRCKYAPSMKLYGQGGSVVYATPNQQWGRSSVQDMKNLMVDSGPLSIALDAGGLSGSPGAINLCDGQNIDHAVMLVGWDDAKGPNGCFIMRNSWGTGWGDGGYCWLDYKSYIVEAFAVNIPPLTPPAPALAVTVGSLNATVNTARSFTIVISGGVAPYTQTWDYGDSTAGTTPSHTYTTAGTYTAKVTVKDSASPASSVTATSTVTVTTDPVPPIPDTLTPGALQIDWDAKILKAGANWSVSGGKIGDNMIDLSGLKPGFVKGIKELIANERGICFPDPKASNFPNCKCEKCICYGTCSCKDGKCSCDRCQPTKKPTGLNLRPSSPLASRY